MIKEITKQYIAGFFDGEGCIGVYHRKNRGFHLRTQLTQNKTAKSEIILNYLLNKYGGNLEEQITNSKKIKYNWQLSSKNAMKLLEDIKPHLIIKKDQAEIALAWQKQRPKIVKDEKGRFAYKEPISLELDIKVSNLIKNMNKNNEQQSDLVEIITKLTPLAVVKG